MRIIIALLTFLIYSTTNGQDLKNIQWIKIKVQRKDGSKLIDRIGSEKESIKYVFTNDSVFTAINQQYPLEQKYSVDNNIISIGDFQNYKIDSLNNTYLGITQISNHLADDKLNSFVFINSEYIFEYLRKTQQLIIIGDSLIEGSSQLSPTFKGDIDKLFMSQFKSPTDSKLLTGSFIISSDGNIKKVHIDTTEKFSKGEIKKIISIIDLTKGSWVLPRTPTPFQFKIDFSLQFSNFAPLFGINMIFYSKDQKQSRGLTVQQSSEAGNHFNNGIRLFNKDKFEKAADEFEKCIEIDSINIDAYYNMAYSYQKLGNTMLACETWKKLKEMGQKEGEKLYYENCK